MRDVPPDSSPRGTIAAFVLLALALVGAMLLLLSTRPQPVEITVLPPAPTATASPSATPAPIMVYVTGAVAQPDTTITLPHHSRVQDALLAAGGALAGADLARVNLAGILRDGDQVHVPLLGEDAPAQPTRSGGEMVNVNAATLDELMTLPGIGQVTAQAILDYRAANGAFADLSALDAVDGIGASTLEAIAPLVVFE